MHRTATQPLNDPSVSRKPIDHAAIAYLEKALSQLRTGAAVGFVGALHLADGRFDLCLSHSVAAVEGMEAANALGELMHRLG